MGLIGTIVVGLIVGAIARFILPGEQKMGWILTGLVGIGGSLVAGYVGQALGMYAVGEAGRLDRLGGRRAGAAVRGAEGARQAAGTVTPQR